MEVKQSGLSCSGSALFKYAFEGDTNKLREVLAKGGPLGTDTVGTTSLHCATMGNQREICEILLRAGISADVRTKVDRTPLHIAVFYGHEDLVKMYLNLKCSVFSCDMFLMTPLHWAVQKRHPSIVRLLLERGADPYAVSKFHKTPRSIAEEEEFDEILHLFEQYSTKEGQKEAIEASDSLMREMKKERVATNDEHMTDIVDYEDVDEDEGRVDTMSIFDEDDVVEVISAAEEENDDDIEEDIAVDDQESRVVAQDSDESFSNLHETIDKLGSIRGEWDFVLLQGNVDIIYLFHGLLCFNISLLAGLKTSDATTLKILQNIGIQMSDDQDPTIISNVLQSGRRIVLSEAGKYILDQTKASDKLDVPVIRPQQSQPNNNHVPVATSTPQMYTRSKRLSTTRPADNSSCTSTSLVKRQRLTDMDRILAKDVKPFTTNVDSAGNLVLRKKTNNSDQAAVKVEFFV